VPGIPSLLECIILASKRTYQGVRGVMPKGKRGDVNVSKALGDDKMATERKCAQKTQGWKKVMGGGAPGDIKNGEKEPPPLV